MYCGKFLGFIFNVILPFSILCIFLFQLYAQYSTLITLRTMTENDKDGRNSVGNYFLSNTKEYDFNMDKIKETFDENTLMNVKFLKNITLNFFDALNNNNENKKDIRDYMLNYLIIYDIISLIIVYIFIYGSIKAGIIKIIFQIFRLYFNSKRLQKFNHRMSLYNIIRSKIENFYSYRGWNIFNPEGFFVIEFLCNFTVILDIILLAIYIYRKYQYNKRKNIKEVIRDEDKANDSDKENGEIISKSNNIDKESKNSNNDEDSNDNISDNNKNINNEKDDEKPKEISLKKSKEADDKEEEEEEDDEKEDENENENVSDEVGETK